MRRAVILASSSPQRADILRELGIEFDAVSMDVDEVVLSTPEETVRTNARLKALAAHSRFPEEAVITADTVISHDGRVLGKPRDAIEAEAILASLSGHEVKAFSAVAVVNAATLAGCVATECAVAHMRHLTGDEISWYIETREPLTRAGALGISRYGEIFIERIDGTYSCFAGLPKRALLAAISTVGLTGELLPNGLPANPGRMATDLTITCFELA